ncbi:MAG TPA: hypothetical protein VNL14_16755 [Candidatus Acidoferrales bacterium]|nr:hypothetical protein [Candidatus Acidoferrales bacterium]
MEEILFALAWLVFPLVIGALLVPNQGEQIALEALVNKTAPQNLVLRLFKNNVTPAEGDTEANYTEADFTGYSAITLTGANWTVTTGAPSEASYAQQTFSSSANQAAQNIYGYYLTQVTSGKLVWAERFTDGPYPIANNGDQIKVTPKITLE